MKNNIRVERAILRISQQELADAIGVTRQTIYALSSIRSKRVGSLGFGAGGV